MKPKKQTANAKRQTEYVNRQRGAGLKMLRGVWVPEELHDEIKAKLIAWLKEMQR